MGKIMSYRLTPGTFYKPTAWCARLAALLLTLSFTPLQAGEKPLPDVNTFPGKVKHKMLEGRAEKNPLEGHSYHKKVSEEQLNRDGHVKGREVKEYEVYHFGRDETYNRLVARNGAPVPAGELKKQDSEFEGKHRRLQTRTSLSRGERDAKDAEWRRERRQQIEETFAAFNFKMLGRTTLDGRPALMIQFTPRPEARLQSRLGKAVMKKIAGTVWIEENEHEPMQIHIEATDTITVGGGMLAKADRGTRLVYRWRRGRDGQWRPDRSETQVRAKVLMVKGYHLRRVEEYWGYERLTSEMALQLR